MKHRLGDGVEGSVCPKTTYWPPESGDAGVREAAEVLVSGGIVAFPTETVYGLGGDARRPEAVERIFAAKGRPADNPLIVHVGRLEDAVALAAGVSPLERRLMERFWPGPLTLVLPVRPGAVAPQVTAGLDTVAVRVPDHPLARRLIAEAGCPVAAPSANRSGRPSPTLAAHVLEDLNGRIDGVLDGGPTGVGLESTVVRVLDGVIYILRPGGVTAEMLQACAGDDAVVVDATEGAAAPAGCGGTGAETGNGAGSGGADSAGAGSAGTGTAGGRAPDAPAGRASAAAVSDPARPRSPGVKYAHYAPRGEMLLVTGDPARMREAVQAAARRKREEGRRVGILACSEHAAAYEADAVIALGSREAPAEVARNLYAALRECDARELEAIVAEGFPETGIGAALMNRLRKAAGGNVLIV